MNRFIPSSLRAQLILVLLGAIIITQSLSLYLFVDEREQAILTSTAYDATSRVMSVANEIETQPAFIHPVILKATQSNGFRMYISVAPPAIATNTQFLDALKSRNIERFGLLRNQNLIFTLNNVTKPAIPQSTAITIDNNHRELTVSYQLRDMRWISAVVTLHELPFIWAWRAIIPLALMTLTLVLVVWYLVARVSGPLRNLARAATRIGHRQKLEALPFDGPDELKPLTLAFNQMAKRLTYVLREKSQMLAAIGHDLRSPITAMRIRTELLPEGENKDRFANCIDEIETLVQGALMLAKSTDSGEETTQFGLHSLIKEVVEEASDLGEDAQTDRLLPVAFIGRRVALKRAIRNVITNAVRYGGFARVDLTASDDAVTIKIYDGGPGIPVDQQERIFEPFVRLESSRCRLTGGTGLGLTIAKSVIGNHGGTIHFETAMDGAFCVVMTLPPVDSKANADNSRQISALSAAE
jgi:signal transduction histidine kinase